MWICFNPPFSPLHYFLIWFDFCTFTLFRWISNFLIGGQQSKMASDWSIKKFSGYVVSPLSLLSISFSSNLIFELSFSSGRFLIVYCWTTIKDCLWLVNEKLCGYGVIPFSPLFSHVIWFLHSHFLMMSFAEFFSHYSW